MYNYSSSASRDAPWTPRRVQRASAWCRKNGFETALAALIVFDSFIHGGLEIVRKRFPEVPPAKGGNEERWLTAYVSARHSWLANHKRQVLHATVYRTRCWMQELSRKNWDLSKLPILINGSKVS